MIRVYKHAIVKRAAAGADDRAASAHFTRSIRCAASSRIAAISCSSSSSSPSRPTRWRSAVIKFLTARPIAGPALLLSRGCEVAQPLEQRLDLLLALLEMRAAFVGDLERLARAFARRFLDQAHVLEQGQRRIDDARARRIFAAGQLLDRADQVVAVARLVGDQLEQHEPELAAFEHPAGCAGRGRAAPALRPVAEVEVERAPIACQPRPPRIANRPSGMLISNRPRGPHP